MMIYNVMSGIIELRNSEITEQGNTSNTKKFVQKYSKCQNWF